MLKVLSDHYVKAQTEVTKVLSQEHREISLEPLAQTQMSLIAEDTAEGGDRLGHGAAATAQGHSSTTVPCCECVVETHVTVTTLGAAEVDPLSQQACHCFSAALFSFLQCARMFECCFLNVLGRSSVSSAG